MILRTGEWQFDELPDKIGHYRAAAATLRVKMTDIWDGHIVGKIKFIVPICIPVENTGAETNCAKAARVLVNLPRASVEFFMIGVEPPVMLEVVDIHLKSTPNDLLQKLIRHRISVLWNNLERAVKTKAFIQIHQFWTKVLTVVTLDIMSNDDAAGKLLRPEPNERHFFQAVGAYCQSHQPPVNPIHSGIDGPLRKWNLVPVSQVNFLEAFANRHSEKWPKPVVDFSNCQIGQAPRFAKVGSVAFTQQVLDYFRRIKRQTNARRFER